MAKAYREESEERLAALSDSNSIGMRAFLSETNAKDMNQFNKSLNIESINANIETSRANNMNNSNNKDTFRLPVFQPVEENIGEHDKSASEHRQTHRDTSSM
jgi:hypothetical protein